MTQSTINDHLDNPPGDPEHSTHHIVPVGTYLMVFAGLMVLLVMTLVAASFDLGEANLIIAVTIAVLKALLVILYFMHLRWSTKLTQVFAGAALVWLLILFVLTLADFFSRSWIHMPA